MVREMKESREMESIKVLIVDKNILVRRALTSILRKYDIFEVTWMADGFHNIEDFIQARHPDVVLLSIDDIDSDGLTILSMLHSRFAELPIIAISPRTKEGAEAAISALRLGAVDFVTKPEHKNLILFAERHLEKRLGPIIKAAKKFKQRYNITEEILETLVHPQRTFGHFGADTKPYTPAEIVVIGGCTGGVQALFSLVESLPRNINAPLVVVQHLPRIYTKHLAQKLDSISNITVREVRDRVVLDDGDIWIAPGGYQCEIDQTGYQNVLRIHRGLRENNMRPSIDILFRSAARVYGKKALAILLSGCGYDGIAGAKEIVNREGQFIVQDPRTAIGPELPLTAIRNELTREYYSPEELAKQIVHRVLRVSDEQEESSPIVGNDLIF